MFAVPERASFESRGYFVRVVVRSKSIVGIDSFLGQADVQFSSLKEEEPLEGWFPLRSTKSSLKASVKSLTVQGSIRLKLQWIHSSTGLVNYSLKKLEE